MQVSLRVKGVKKFANGIKGLRNGIQNKRPAFAKVAVQYRGWIGRNFQAEGGLHSDTRLKWKALKKSTKENRRKGGGGAKILQDTGALKGRWEISSGPSFARIKSGVHYSSVHEKGASIKPHVIRPKRGKALKFKFKGKTVFAKSVKHPGAKIPRRKIFPTNAQANRDIIVPVFGEHLMISYRKGLRKGDR